MTNDDGEPDIERIEKEQYSTVYRGIRFYFDTPEQLEVFCMVIEQKEERWLTKQKNNHNTFVADAVVKAGLSVMITELLLNALAVLLYGWKM